ARRRRRAEGVSARGLARIDDVTAEREAAEDEAGAGPEEAEPELDVLEPPADELAREAADRPEQRAREREVAGVGERPGLLEPVEVVEAGAQGRLARAIRDDGERREVLSDHVAGRVQVAEVVEVVAGEVAEQDRVRDAPVHPIEMPEKVGLDRDVGVEEREPVEARLIGPALPRL